MATMAWMRGDLNGNGPVDRQKRQMWLDAKWEPRTIKLGAVRVGYDQFEPFNLIMSTIADVGDASELMVKSGQKVNYKRFLLLLHRRLQVSHT